MTEAPDPDRREAPAESTDRLRPVALAVLTVALLALCVAVAVPFLPAITWGVALAIIAWPVHQWLARLSGRAGLAAAVTTALVAAVIVGGAVFVTYQVAAQVAEAAQQTGDKPAVETLRDRATRSPTLARAAEWLDHARIDLRQQVEKLAEPFARNAAGIAQGSLGGVVQLAVALFILFHLLRDRAALVKELRGYLPLTRAEADRVFTGFADSVHANLYATVLTSLIDAVTGGLLFWAVGVPAPALWAVVMFVISIIPLLGTWLVWVPAAAYLAMNDNVGGAAAVCAWGVTTWVVVDSLLYVRMAGDRMKLHAVPALIAFLGGLAVFGAAGMVLGPAVLAVTVAVLDVWRRRNGSDPDEGVQVAR